MKLTEEQKEQLDAIIGLGKYVGHERYEYFIGDGRHTEWLSSVNPLKRSKVLEIGCEVGSSTAVLLESGADVTAIDIDSYAMDKAKKRLDIMGLPQAEFIVDDASAMTRIKDNTYDFAIFYACLEHLTHVERKLSIRNAWNKLKRGGLLVVIDCPNRLWIIDEHTTHQPFYNWINDEMALELKYTDAGDFLRLARLGRGVSYHDIELALGDTRKLDILPGMLDWQRSINENTDNWWSRSPDIYPTFHRLLCAVAPDIHRSFFYQGFEIMIRKS